MPFAEIGINDDWSYIFTAQTFARTGHLAFNGWAAPILGWMVPWGALFARLFGMSFTAVRLSMVPLGMLCAACFWAVLRRFGLNAAHATCGTLCFVLSPLFTGMTAVFLSDVPGVLSVLLCIYCCQRAIEAATLRSVAVWLALASLGNVVTGSVRQTSWLGALVVVPCCGYLLRKRRGVVLLTAVLWVLSVVGIALIVDWFNHQPYVPPEKLIQGHLTGALLAQLMGQLLRGALTVLLLVVPVTAAALYGIRGFSRQSWYRCCLILAGVLALLVVLKYTGHLSDWLPPWLSAIMDTEGIMHGGSAVGAFGPPMGLRWREGIAAAVILASVAFLASASTYDTGKRRAELPVSARTVRILLLPLLICYVGLLLPRATFDCIYDRYLLIPVAIVLVFLLRWHQERMNEAVPAISFVLIVVFGLVSVLGLHDLFAMNRAHVRIARELELAGTPRTQFFGGFGFDGWTQLEASGYMNNPLIQRPAGVYHRVQFDDDSSSPCYYSFQRFTPVIHARYAIVKEILPCFGPSPFAPVSYRTWLPPGTRHLYVQTLPTSGPAAR
ncbi:MAG TPA: glycosyltransferase family 39 protein [Acidobacteriaceae bacterium]